MPPSALPLRLLLRRMFLSTSYYTVPPSKTTVYVIDYGLAKKFRDLQTHKHIQDGLFLVTNSLDLVSGYPMVILTPNINEYKRLVQNVLSCEVNDQDAPGQLLYLAKWLSAAAYLVFAACVSALLLLCIRLRNLLRLLFLFLLI